MVEVEDDVKFLTFEGGGEGGFTKIEQVRGGSTRAEGDPNFGENVITE